MENSVQFHVLSFEGPDAYARAGGIASRVAGLTEALARQGFETHLWFVGDPALPAVEQHGTLTLHRWCQWISQYHPAGVYDGEVGKCHDYAASLPPYLLDHYLLPCLAEGRRAVVLAEEWHTVDAVVHLDKLLRTTLSRDLVSLLWNANNTFGFEHIDWQRLNKAATLTTVSRYMKHRMWSHHVDPIVIPNGLGTESYMMPDESSVRALCERFAQRTFLTKVARWDPDKRWLLALDTVAELKRRRQRPLLIARGGKESYGYEVLQHARRIGLEVVERRTSLSGEEGMLECLSDVKNADVVVLGSHLDPQARAALLRASDAVLANSGHEPFGLVGLETMAVGGLACTGASGEDYAVDGENAFVLQTDDPREFVSMYDRSRRDGERGRSVRMAGMQTALRYAWPAVIQRSLIPRIDQEHASR